MNPNRKDSGIDPDHAPLRIVRTSTRNMSGATRGRSMIEEIPSRAVRKKHEEAQTGNIPV